MELKRHLQVLNARRWFVIIPFLITTIAAGLFTVTQTPTYQSVAKYVVKTNLIQSDARDLAAALGLLTRYQIEPTVAEVARSSTIKAKAATALGLAANDVKRLSVDGRPLGGTNVVQIVVAGPDAVLARAFASAVGTETAAFVQSLYGMYELEILDQPTTPSAPVRPNGMLNVLLGALVGLLLGSGLAFLPTYLQASSEGNAPTSDPDFVALPGQKSRSLSPEPAKQRNWQRGQSLVGTDRRGQGDNGSRSEK